MPPCRGVHCHAFGMSHGVGRVRQFVEVGREQRPAAHDVVEVLHRGLRDGEPIMRRGAASYLVKDHQ